MGDSREFFDVFYSSFPCTVCFGNRIWITKIFVASLREKSWKICTTEAGLNDFKVIITKMLEEGVSVSLFPSRGARVIQPFFLNLPLPY